MTTLQMETLDACPLCGAVALRHTLTAPDYESHTGNYGIDECGGCGAAFTNPRPVETDLPKLYAQRSTVDFPALDSGLVARLRDFAIDRYLADPLRCLNSAPTERSVDILDYGCGDGALARGLVRAARKHGRDYRITATDFHDAAPPRLAGIESIRYVPQAHSQNEDFRYHAIFLRHVVEHHPQPDRLIRELKTRLHPGGRLFIEVPNRRSIWARAFGGAYCAYNLPRHLFHFDARSLSGAIERGNLRCERVALAHTPLLGHSLGYLLSRKIQNTGLVGVATYPLQIAVDALARTSSTLRATAVADG